MALAACSRMVSRNCLIGPFQWLPFVRTSHRLAHSRAHVSSRRCMLALAAGSIQVSLHMTPAARCWAAECRWTGWCRDVADLHAYLGRKFLLPDEVGIKRESRRPIAIDPVRGQRFASVRRRGRCREGGDIVLGPAGGGERGWSSCCRHPAAQPAWRGGSRFAVGPEFEIAQCVVVCHSVVHRQYQKDHLHAQVALASRGENIVRARATSSQPSMRLPTPTPHCTLPRCADCANADRDTMLQ